VKLPLTSLVDRTIRDAFRTVQDFLNQNRQFEGFRHLEIEIDGAVTNLKYPHLLGFQPKDVVVTSQTGAGQITWNYDKFDRELLDITTTGAVTVRVYVGTHKEGTDA
jgi:hypothetical protein